MQTKKRHCQVFCSKITLFVLFFCLFLYFLHFLANVIYCLHFVTQKVNVDISTSLCYNYYVWGFFHKITPTQKNKNRGGQNIEKQLFSPA